MTSELKKLENQRIKQVKIMRESKYNLEEISKYNSILYKIGQLKEKTKWKKSTKKGYNPPTDTYKIPGGTVLSQ